MDKQKQIEGMAKVLEFCCNGENIENCNSDRSCDSCRAKYLYNAGYRKIPENAVVLTREEFDKNLEPFRLEIIVLSQELVETSQKLMNSRKETAEKFAERLKEYVVDDFSEYDYGYLCMKIDGMCKKITDNII